MLDVLELPYVAGLFDGEGCIHVSRQIRNTRPIYRLDVSIVNTNREILFRLKDRWRGTVQNRPHTALSANPISSWRVVYCDATLFLSDIQPWLRLKANQADIALNFSALTQARGVGHRGLTAEDLALREGFYLALREAKKVPSGT